MRIIISCCGVPNLVKKDWVKKDAIILDVGINKIETPQGPLIVGDVDFEDVKDVVSYITPVPGGIGPMTISMLVKQIVESCERISSKFEYLYNLYNKQTTKCSSFVNLLSSFGTLLFLS